MYLRTNIVVYFWVPWRVKSFLSNTINEHASVDSFWWVWSPHSEISMIKGGRQSKHTKERLENDLLQVSFVDIFKCSNWIYYIANLDCQPYHVEKTVVY